MFDHLAEMTPEHERYIGLDDAIREVLDYLEGFTGRRYSDDQKVEMVTERLQEALAAYGAQIPIPGENH